MWPANDFQKKVDERTIDMSSIHIYRRKANSEFWSVHPWCKQRRGQFWSGICLENVAEGKRFNKLQTAHLRVHTSFSCEFCWQSGVTFQTILGRGPGGYGKTEEYSTVICVEEKTSVLLPRGLTHHRCRSDENI